MNTSNRKSVIRSDGNGFIISSTTEIKLYQYSTSNSCTPISTFSDLGSIRTTDYSQNSSLVAAGLTSGKTVILSTTTDSNDPTSKGSILSPRNQRPVNVVKFCENGLIAIGLEKARGESLLIHDLNRFEAEQRPICQFGAAEAVYAASFISPSNSSSLILASFQKTLRLFDIRSSEKSELTVYSTKANDILPNPTNSYQFVTCEDESIKLFDLRKPELSLLSFSDAFSAQVKKVGTNARHTPLEVVWNERKRGQLGVLNIDSNSVRIWNMLDGDSSRLPLLYDESLSSSFSQIVTSFAFSPSHGSKQSIVGVSRALTPGSGHSLEFLPLPSSSKSVFTTAGVNLYPVKSATPVASFTIPLRSKMEEEDIISDLREKRGRTMSAISIEVDRDTTIGPLERRPSDYDTQEERHDLRDLVQDPSVEMRRRVDSGYGMRAELNAEMIQSSTIQEFWRFIHRSELLASHSYVYDYDFRFRGAIEILKSFSPSINSSSRKSNSKSAYANVLSTLIKNRRLNEISFIPGGKLNQERLLILSSICGKDFEEPFHVTCERYIRMENGAGIDLAAKHAVLCGKFNEAISFLRQSKDQRLSHLAPVLASYISQKTELSSLFTDLCRSLAFDSDLPWINALFSFLGTSDWREFIDEGGLLVEERLAIACRVLPDNALLNWVEELGNELMDSGDLSGVRIFGMRNLGLLSSFLDRTADIQTVALSISFIYPIILSKSNQLERWIQTYRTFLDSQGLFHSRAIFDGLRGKRGREEIELLKSFGKNLEASKIVSHLKLQAPAQFLIRCTYCSVTISGESKNSGLKSTLCPSCSKALPSCTICLRPVSTAGGSSISFCFQCKHGGHSHHLAAWFDTSILCPVADCNCNCSSV